MTGQRPDGALWRGPTQPTFVPCSDHWVLGLGGSRGAGGWDLATHCDAGEFVEGGGVHACSVCIRTPVQRWRGGCWPFPALGSSRIPGEAKALLSADRVEVVDV
jgi:hypothetical protein